MENVFEGALVMWWCICTVAQLQPATPPPAAGSAASLATGQHRTVCLHVESHGITALPPHPFPCLPDPVPLSALKDHKDGEALAGWSLFSAGANLQSLHYVPQKAFDFIMDEM